MTSGSAGTGAHWRLAAAPSGPRRIGYRARTHRRSGTGRSVTIDEQAGARMRTSVIADVALQQAKQSSVANAADRRREIR
ncbi:MAG: hypothetical protein WKF38_06480 [Candidatus Limnocylindrales bacterium]